MSFLILPRQPGRAELVSFWLALSVGAGIALGLGAVLLASPDWVVLGALTVLFVAIAGVLVPRRVTRPYSWWNRLARAYVETTRKFLLKICFYVLLVAVARAGSRLGLARPARGESLWVTRGTLVPEAYASQSSLAGGKDRAWVGNLAAWNLRSGYVWAITLIPFLALLRLLETSQTESPPTSIYTLY